MKRPILLSILFPCSYVLSQGIDVNMVDAAPQATASGAPYGAINQTNVYNQAAAASAAAGSVAAPPPAHKRSVPFGRRGDSFDKRDGFGTSAPCSPVPPGTGPLPNPNTLDGFLGSPQFEQLAKSVPIMPGYMPSFMNLRSATQQNSYIAGYTLPAYDTFACASLCDTTRGCQAFNLFLERDPSQVVGPGCTNPVALVNVKCTLWGSPITVNSAGNQGGKLGDTTAFQVAIAASNGWNKIVPYAPIIDGFDIPSPFAAAINSDRLFLAAAYYNQPFDPAVCAAVCRAATSRNRQAALAAKAKGGSNEYRACNYFNAFSLQTNGIAQGLYCGLYSDRADLTAATLNGVQDRGRQFTVGISLGYTLSKRDAGYVQ